MATTKAPRHATKTACYRLRESKVHGTGVFATRPLRKGVLILEYLGERITHEEADRRHEHKADDDNHTFLFTIDENTVVDAGVDGNDARYINHSCEPNCEVILDSGQLFVEAIRAIGAGEELAYDYNITRVDDDPPEVERVFGCRCGTATCRGTMLQPKKTAKSDSKPIAKKVRSKRGR